jgi:MFS family permease
MAAGPLLGGMLVSAAGWRSVFAVNVVIGIPALIWSLRSMPPVPRRDRRLGIPGMTVATVLIGGLVFALIEGPVRGWASPAVLAAIGLAIVGGVVFATVERATGSPLLPLGLYADRVFTATAAQGALFNLAHQWSPAVLAVQSASTGWATRCGDCSPTLDGDDEFRVLGSGVLLTSFRKGWISSIGATASFRF